MASIPRSLALLLPLTLAPLGCAHTAPVVAATGPAVARVAVPCAALSARRRNIEPARVFLEVAEVVHEREKDSLEEVLREQRPVTVRATAGTIANNHETVKFAWTRCRDARCEVSAPATLAVTPKLPSLPSGTIAIDVHLGAVDAGAEVHTVVSAHDQRPAVVSELRSADGAHVSTLVVTPYLINGQDDLRALASCKAADAKQ